MIGLDINAANPADRLVNTKPLLIPSRGGAGYAYYNWDHCGFSSGSDAGDENHIDYFGKAHGYLIKGDWIIMHEIGHGYEGMFQRSKEMPMVEIKTNILGTYWQMTYLDFTKEADRQRSWLFIRNETPNVIDERVVERRNSGIAPLLTGPGETHFRNRLYLMMTMTNAGAATIEEAKNALAAINRLNRKNPEWSIANLYAKGLYNSRQINIIPFLESFDFIPSDLVKAQVFEGKGRIALPFRDITNNWSEHLFPDDGRLLWGSLSLVRPNEIDLGKGKPGTINIIIDNLDLIKGQSLRIRDGSEIVHTATISGATVNVPALPAGGYYIDLPQVTGKQPYTAGYNVLTVMADSAVNATVTYIPLTRSSVAGLTQIRLRGTRSVALGTIKYDPKTESVIIEGTGANPHRNTQVAENNNGDYVRIEVKRGNEITLERTARVNDNTWQGTDIIENFGPNDTIFISHAEANVEGAPTGVLAINSLSNQADDGTNFLFQNNQRTALVVTKYGLAQTGTTNQQQVFTNNFNVFLNQFINNIPEDKVMGMCTYHDIKADILLASDMLSETDKAAFDNNFGRKFRE